MVSLGNGVHVEIVHEKENESLVNVSTKGCNAIPDPRKCVQFTSHCSQTTSSHCPYLVFDRHAHVRVGYMCIM